MRLLHDMGRAQDDEQERSDESCRRENDDAHRVTRAARVHADGTTQSDCTEANVMQRR